MRLLQQNQAQATVQLLWFQDCPNHDLARQLLREVLGSDDFEDIDATEPEVAERLHFPGSPTIRVDGMDIEPGYEDAGDYTPRCRLYDTAVGMNGVPERVWIEAALDRLKDRLIKGDA